MAKDTRFQLVWDEACRAAQLAAEKKNAQLDQNGRSFEGSAWITVPAKSPFARWAEKHLNISRHEETVMIRDAEFHRVYTPAVSVHEAAAQAARNVLARSLTSAIGMGSELDPVIVGGNVEKICNELEPCNTDDGPSTATLAGIQRVQKALNLLGRPYTVGYADVVDAFTPKIRGKPIDEDDGHLGYLATGTDVSCLCVLRAIMKSCGYEAVGGIGGRACGYEEVGGMYGAVYVRLQ
jgi:hypothetical protein